MTNNSAPSYTRAGAGPRGWRGGGAVGAPRGHARRASGEEAVLIELTDPRRGTPGLGSIGRVVAMPHSARVCSTFKKARS